jgi:hypothetical protein
MWQPKTSYSSARPPSQWAPNTQESVFTLTSKDESPIINTANRSIIWRDRDILVRKLKDRLHFEDDYSVSEVFERDKGDVALLRRDSFSGHSVTIKLRSKFPQEAGPGEWAVTVSEFFRRDSPPLESQYVRPSLQSLLSDFF